MSDNLPEAYQNLLSLMRERRSIRRFREEPLPAGTLERLLEAARWAPSASNRQPFRFLAIEAAEVRTGMADLVREAVEQNLGRMAEPERGAAAAYAEHFVGFEKAPLVLAVSFRARNLLAERLDLPAEWDLGAVSSASAAVMNLLLAAHALGLGACWMTGPLLAAPRLEAFLGVPTGWRLSAIIPVGMAAETPAAPVRRTVSQLLVRRGGSS
jgi:coenzyme F420-0:L-glutamate ligase / coenzyme F420-1:gamma-L-glutamate ligase